MAMSVVYTTINGVLYHENRGGVETEYVPDTLGSLIQCRDSSGNVTYTADYWPYGEVRASTGSKASPWGFVGLLGYHTDIAKRLYVRARQYRPNVGQWQTVDPLWPDENAYGYSAQRPVDRMDVDGLRTISPASFPEGCQACAQAIKDNWVPLPQHRCNAWYAHCTACCVLTLLSGKDCAIDTQSFQNWVSNPGEKYVLARWRYCGIGLGAANRIGEASDAFNDCSAACLSKCPYRNPNPRKDCNKLITPKPQHPGFGKPTFPPAFPPLTQCDPDMWRRCKAGIK